MQRPTEAASTLTTPERLLAGFILFYGALVFCLPVPYSDEVAGLYPWWAKAFSVGNVFLHEIAFMVWMGLYGWRFLVQALLTTGTPARHVALGIIALAVWCGLISLSAPAPVQDVGRTFRLILMALLMLAVVRWTRMDNTFPLRMLLLGFLVGTLINLVISFQYPLVIGGTMRLSGQNTPGVAMGIALHLSAWLFYCTRSVKVQVFALLSAAIFAFSCAISYSRIGWFGGGFGLLVWFYVLFLAQPSEPAQKKRNFKLRRVLVPLAVVGCLVAPAVPVVQDGFQWMAELVAQKVAGQHESDAARWGYVKGTADILLQHPLGVGYSGFYDAMTATQTYRSGEAIEEESPTEANPHASFLWYATAGGVPGALMAVVLFGLLAHRLYLGLVCALRRPGLVFFGLIVLPYLVIGLTVPYLFNSMIMIVPTAIAAGWGWSGSMRGVQPSSMQGVVAVRG